MLDLLRHLPDLKSREARVWNTIQEWCGFRTGSFDTDSLQAFANRLVIDFADLGAEPTQEEMPPALRMNAQGQREEWSLGPCLIWRKRPEAKRQILLAIHTDVVYADSERTAADLRITRDGDWLLAAGAADAKGGIAIIHEALWALEQSPYASHLGWRVVLNPDEEIGSPGSSDILKREAASCQLGLLFEPSLPDGSLVGSRKGSGNFTVAMHGRAAHAGRNPQEGRNAILALAELIREWSDLPQAFPGMTVNVGRFQGGGSVNRVPDFALAEVNMRIDNANQMSEFENWRKQQASKWETREGYRCEWFGGFTAPPKILTGKNERWMKCILECGEALGMKLQVHPSGGVCDGNRLSAAGLPNVDTLGPIGQGIHGAGEKLYLPSVTQRIQWVSLILLRLAQDSEWATFKDFPPASNP